MLGQFLNLKSSSTTITESLGFYVDDDGYLCQETEDENDG